MAHQILILGFSLLIVFSLASTSSSSPLQDFCVAKLNSQVFVDGLECEDPKLAKAEDFHFGGLHIPGDTSNQLGSTVNHVFVDRLPGLNTLGIGTARIDFAPGGVNPPHIHPRATEILTVLEGTIYAGFVTSNPSNRLISKILQKDDVFIFPRGLIHFQHNVGSSYAVAIAALNSENPGVITVANAVFGSNGPISADLLAKAFQVDKKVVDEIQSKF